MPLSRAVVRLSVILDGTEEIIEEVDYDEYVESSFNNHEEGEIDLQDLKFCMIENFVQDRLSKYT
jgi:hypothetical protein